MVQFRRTEESGEIEEHARRLSDSGEQGEGFLSASIIATLRVAALGYVTGIRSMTPLALLSWTTATSEGEHTPVGRLLESPVARTVLSVAALGEIVADKLPIIPSRTSPGPLLGRLVIGGVAGMLLCRRLQQPLVLGIISGATGAGLGAVASTTSRAWLSKTTKTPQALWGGVEDIEAVALGLLVTRENSP